jgi:glutaminyl-peptide cyclotransferase
MKSAVGIIALLFIGAVSIAGCGQKYLPIFDSNNAYSLLKAQCDFGPRNPNSEGQRKCLQYLYEKLSATTDICRRQDFKYVDTLRHDTLNLTNLIASYNPKSQTRILLCAHWDSRPWADNEPDSSLHSKPIIGANDGASGVAILLELAEIFKKEPPQFGIDIAFFDGEDYGSDKQFECWLLGSKYFTQNLGGYRPVLVILLDMVGDSSLQIYKEQYSSTYAGRYVDLIWKAAAIEKAAHFFPETKHAVYDDHIPFLQAGIPAVDLIDIEYPSWHTLADTPDKCSAASLNEVGRVLVRLLYDDKSGFSAK